MNKTPTMGLFENKRMLIEGLSFLAGACIILLAAFVIIISNLLFLLSFHISKIIIILAALATVWLVRRCAQELFPRRAKQATILICASVAVLIALCCGFSGKFHDFWADGQSLHQEAVIQLAAGWNPLHQIESGIPPWANVRIHHYAKGPWLLAASLYALTNHIEQAKAFNLLLMLAGFLLCFSCLSMATRIRAPYAALISLAAAGNPVSVTQALSFYLDGQVASSLLIFGAMAIIYHRRKSNTAAWLLVLSIILVCNTKVTAPFYLFIGMIGILVILRRRGHSLLALSRHFALGLIIGTCLVGFNPYVTNTLRYGNPLATIFNSTVELSMAKNSPANFEHLNVLEKLFVSLFSRSANIVAPAKSSYKLPFTFSWGELPSFVGPDVRVGGFGPLFAGALVLSILILAGLFWIRSPWRVELLIIFLTIMLSCLVNRYCWWARYAPQLWFFPVIAAIAACMSKVCGMERTGKILCVLLCSNVVLVSSAYIYWQQYNNEILLNQLKSIASFPGPVRVKFYDNASNRIRLKEHGISFQAVDALPCKEYLELLAYGNRPTRVCLDYSAKIADNPTDAQAFNGRGNIELSRNDFEQALSDYTRAIELDPSQGGFYNNRAVAYFELGKFDAARSDLLKAQALGFKVSPMFLRDIEKASAKEP